MIAKIFSLKDNELRRIGIHLAFGEMTVIMWVNFSFTRGASPLADLSAGTRSEESGVNPSDKLRITTATFKM